MVNVIATIQIKEGQLSKFIEIFKKNIPMVLKEKGCMEYVPTIDVPTGLPPQKLNINGVTIIEKWNSLADLKAHISSPHMLAYKEKTKHIVDNMSVRILEEV